MEDITKFEVSVTKIMCDAFLYFDLYHINVAVRYQTTLKIKETLSNSY